MKLNSLRDFLTVAERGSLRAAARSLGVAQPALTRSIQELERELGVVLFERRARGVHLTPMGEVFQRRAASVRSDLRRAQEEIDQLRGETHGHLTVCLSSVPHIALLPNALRPFRTRYPKVMLNVIDAVFPRVEASLLDGTIDCYIGPPPEEIPGETAMEKLFDNTRVILGRKGHPLAHARSLRELVDAEWITTSITHKAEEELGPLFAKHGLPAPKLVMQAQSALSFLVAMAYSDMLMMLPVQWVQFPLWRDVLAVIPVEEVLPAPPVCILYRTGLPLTPAAEYFCDMMRRASMHMHTLAD
ncbi:LysR family transcriptional regulator [Methylibium sp.]|uniref:LysR family transcriptional regulator n=1 Tax=Methylibium sp. TaxID=2067992 RepID=UPI003D0C0638